MGLLDSTRTDTTRTDLPDFDISVFGYDRRQVEQHLAQLTARLEDAMRDVAANAVLQEQLMYAYRELDQLRAVRAASPEENSPWWDRIGRVMTAAEEQAETMRAEAEREAERIRARALAESLQARRNLEAALRAREENARRLEQLFPAHAKPAGADADSAEADAPGSAKPAGPGSAKRGGPGDRPTPTKKRSGKRARDLARS